MIDEITVELAQAWITKANGDLMSAQALTQPPNLLLENAVYHCQQAAEKAIKAILALHALPIPYTHDIAKLLYQAVAHEPMLMQFEERASMITPYATAYRYPDLDAFDLELIDVKNAIEFANEILDLARSHIRNKL